MVLVLLQFNCDVRDTERTIAHILLRKTKEKRFDVPIRNYTKTFGESTLRNVIVHLAKIIMVTMFGLTASEIGSNYGISSCAYDILRRASACNGILQHSNVPIVFSCCCFFRFLVRKKNQLAHHHHFDEFAQNAIVSLWWNEWHSMIFVLILAILIVPIGFDR